MEEISDLMRKNHYRIEQLLKEFKTIYEKNPKLIFSSFDKFKWELEKHLFIEEKAIFIFYSPKDSEDFDTIPNLVQEHRKMLELLNKIENNLKDKNVDISELLKLLIKHRNFEDGTLYPKLDRELEDSKKKIIIERLTENFPIGGKKWKNYLI